MTEQLTSIVNARLTGRDGLHKLTIANGRFTDIIALPELTAVGNNELDAAMTAGEPRWNQSGTLFEGIECWRLFGMGECLYAGKLQRQRQPW